ncbi:MAG: DUF2723 domain-containing protein [Candidatus Eisenbacteria bacterium]|nr:DUF2723 domain-containing protein [Candidatus Eisenbacteria bacterium]MBU1950061.1 DUF2723 domain-containing protein [Candidatus Eisenbacteria bacterium]
MQDDAGLWRNLTRPLGSPRSGATGPPRSPLWFTFLSASLPLLGVYLFSLQRDLGTIDSGELAAVCHTLGIAHPSGYPLYTLLGRLAALIPWGELLTRLHILSALLSAAAAGFTALALRETLDLLFKQARYQKISDQWLARLSVLGAWVWGLSPSVWEQAVVNEVYGLHFVFLSLSVYLGLILLRPSIPAAQRSVLLHYPEADSRHLAFLGYLLGLGFSHHLSLAFVLPSLGLAAGYYLYRRRVRPTARFDSIRWKILLTLIIFFMFGFSVDLYLPLRAAQEPLLNWGDPSSWARWVRHVSGWQYRVWLAPGSDTVITNVLGRIPGIWNDLGWVLPVAAVAGLILSWRRRAMAALFWTILLAVGLIWAASYDIKDIQSYYAASDLAVVALGLSGLAILLSRIRRRKVILTFVMLPVAPLIIFGAFLRWDRCAADGPPLPGLYARGLLEGLPEKTLLFSRQWDTCVSAMLYLQFVEELRPDVAIVDTELLRRSWYYPQLDRMYPGLLDPVRPQRDEFLTDLASFEAGRPYDAVRIETRYQALQKALHQAWVQRRPTAVTPEVDARIFETSLPVPYGMVILFDPPEELLSGRGPLPLVEPFLAFGPRTDDLMARLMRHLISNMAVSRAQFLEEREAPGASVLLEEAGWLRRRSEMSGRN